MPDYTSLPSYMRETPWHVANAYGAAVHATSIIAMGETGALTTTWALDNQGTAPLLVALNVGCSSTFMVGLSTNATFTGTTTVSQTVINRYVYTVRDLSPSLLVHGPLVVFQEVTKTGGTLIWRWLGAGATVVKAFGPGSRTDQYLIVDPTEKLVVEVNRQVNTAEDTASLDVTWISPDPSVIDIRALG